MISETYYQSTILAKFKVHWLSRGVVTSLEGTWVNKAHKGNEVTILESHHIIDKNLNMDPGPSTHFLLEKYQ